MITKTQAGNGPQSFPPTRKSYRLGLGIGKALEQECAGDGVTASTVVRDALTFYFETNPGAPINVRPSIRGTGSTVLTVWLPASLVAQISTHANQHGVPAAGVVRSALVLFLTRSNTPKENN